MLSDFHTHNPETADGVSSIRSFSIHEMASLPSLPPRFSVGVHPWHLGLAPSGWERLLARYASMPQCVMIGEAGLDKCVDVPFESQLECFRAQAALAEQVGKPMVLHVVRAYNEMIRLRKELQPLQTWHIHGFGQSAQMAVECLKSGFGLSFGPRLLTHPKIQEAYLSAYRYVRECGSPQLLHLETDDDTDVTIFQLYDFVETLINP